MPAPLPHVYRATVRRTFASRARIEAAPPSAFDSGPSHELADAPASWSPEHLVLSALGMSMLTTFEAFAARDRIELVRWDASVSGTVERTPEGLMFTSIVVSIEMQIAGNTERVEATLEDAKQYCLVVNSLRVPVVIETQIETVEDAPQLAFDSPAYVARDAHAG